LSTAWQMVLDQAQGAHVTPLFIQYVRSKKLKTKIKIK
jgi:hypothetical protein